MQRAAKWTIGLLAALILATPVALGVWIWTGLHRAGAQQRRDAERIISEFHKRLNAGDLDAICRDAYKCVEFQNVRQDWMSILEETRKRRGMFKSIVGSDIRVSIEPPGVRAKIVSSFERGELREIFEMRDFSGPLQIVTYKVTTEEPSGLMR